MDSISAAAASAGLTSYAAQFEPVFTIVMCCVAIVTMIYKTFYK